MESAVTSVLSSEQVDEFNERGVFKIDFGFEPRLLDQITEKVYPHYDGAFRQKQVPTTRIQDAWKLVDEVRQLAVHEPVLAALEQLLGRRALPFQTLNFPVGTSQPAHSDTIHFNSNPDGYMAGVWVALEDIDAGNGPLIYYPGSHKLPSYSMHDFDLEPGEHNYHLYEQRIRQLIEKEGLEPEYGIIKKGEALVWHANLLHGGAPQKDPGRSRHSQVTHYFFEGSQYYTPLLSSRDEFTFRNPEWIPSTEDCTLHEDPGAREPLGVMNKFLLRVLGFLMLGIGMLGVFLPLLPTTPFVLLAAACFTHSSEKWHQWLLANETFGPMIRDWDRNRCISRRVKLVAIAMMAVMGGFSIFYGVESDLARMIGGGFLLLGVITVSVIKTCGD